MTRSSPRRRPSLAAVIAVGLLVAACGGDDDGDSSSSADTSSPSTAMSTTGDTATRHHAFLLDTMTAESHQHQGIGTTVVRLAVEHAKAAGCEWLHVDFTNALVAFYLDACGFSPTNGGLIHLHSTP